jgi:hypothetical protein
VKRFAALSALLFGLVSGGALAHDNEVVERFMNLSRELRVHRAEMIPRFSDEAPLPREDRSKGLRLYLRWAPSGEARLRNIEASFEAGGTLSRESLPVREERDWGLVWYSALLAKPSSVTGILRVKADVESRRYRTPLQAERTISVFEGSLPIVLSSGAAPLRVIVELDSESPFSEKRHAQRALRLSLLPQDASESSGRAR